MLTLPEFVEFLKYVQANHQEIYRDIVEVRSPWRAEWIDADFKLKDGKLHVNDYHVLDKNGKLIPRRSKLLQKNTLMKDKTPGISLDNWLANPTKQGFPNKKIEAGSLYYWHPIRDNNSVTGFIADDNEISLHCDRYPSNWDSNLGVRAAKVA